MNKTDHYRPESSLESEFAAGRERGKESTGSRPKYTRQISQASNAGSDDASTHEREPAPFRKNRI